MAGHQSMKKTCPLFTLSWSWWVTSRLHIYLCVQHCGVFIKKKGGLVFLEVTTNIDKCFRHFKSSSSSLFPLPPLSVHVILLGYCISMWAEFPNNSLRMLRNVVARVSTVIGKRSLFSCTGFSSWVSHWKKKKILLYTSWPTRPLKAKLHHVCEADSTKSSR